MQSSDSVPDADRRAQARAIWSRNAQRLDLGGELVVVPGDLPPAARARRQRPRSPGFPSTSAAPARAARSVWLRRSSSQSSEEVSSVKFRALCGCRNFSDVRARRNILRAHVGPRLPAGLTNAARHATLAKIRVFFGETGMSRIGELLVREKMLSLQQLQQARTKPSAPASASAPRSSRLGYVNDQRAHPVPRQAVQRAVDQPRRDSRSTPRSSSSSRARSARSTRSSRSAATARRSIVAMADPSNIYAIDDLKFLTSYNIEPVVASEAGDRGRAVALLRQGPRPRPDDRRASTIDNVEFAGDDDENSTSSTSRKAGEERRSSSS